MFGGGVWPVVQRELREAARRRWGHRMRLAAAIGGVLCFYFNFDSWYKSQSQSQMATELFDNIHVLLLDLICLIVPALTADCLARERREGTLGLLFLTPLSASGIVLGKILAQTLRVLTVWMAIVPMLLIPLLIGNVTRTNVINFLALELCAGTLCLAAGILASSLTESRAIALILAFTLAACFVAGAVYAQHWRMLQYARSLPWTIYRASPASAPAFVADLSKGAPGLHYHMAGGGAVAAVMTGGLPLAFHHPPPGILAEDVAVAFLTLLAGIYFAGYGVKCSWQEKAAPVWRQNLLKRFCAPLSRRTLEWNPIAWLQQYSWKARLSKWGMCLLLGLLACVFKESNGTHWLAWTVLAVAYTFAGVHRLLEDKKNGALELILVCPLSTKEIIFGRIWGLWKQFLPSLIFLMTADIAGRMLQGKPSGPYHDAYWRLDWSWGGWFWLNHLEIILLYLTLPVFATSFALRFKNMFMAAATTWAAVLLPIILLLPINAEDTILICIPILAGNVLTAMFALDRLEDGLAQRTYSFS